MIGVFPLKGTVLPTYNDFYKNTTLERRKSQGQYMTPNTLAEYLVDSVPIKDGDSILEPALGTGQLLVPILKKYPEMKLTIEGWEKDSQVLEYVEPEVSAHVSVLNVSSLSHAIETDQDKYDVIMSNPPFYEFKPDKETKDNYGDVFSGRANIFSASFKLSIDLTKPGGHIRLHRAPINEQWEASSKSLCHTSQNTVPLRALGHTQATFLKKPKLQSDHCVEEENLRR